MGQLEFPFRSDVQGVASSRALGFHLLPEDETKCHVTTHVDRAAQPSAAKSAKAAPQEGTRAKARSQGKADAPIKPLMQLRSERQRHRRIADAPPPVTPCSASTCNRGSRGDAGHQGEASRE